MLAKGTPGAPADSPAGTKGVGEGSTPPLSSAPCTSLFPQLSRGAEPRRSCKSVVPKATRTSPEHVPKPLKSFQTGTF